MTTSYLKYDSFGLAEVSCMNCGCKVAERAYVSIRDHKNPDPTATINVMTLKKLSNYRQTEVDLEDDKGKFHSFINPIVCVGCVEKKLDEKDLMDKVRLGWVEDMKAHGKPDIEVMHKLKPYDKIQCKHRKKGAING